MSSGRQTLASIDQALNDASGKVDALETQIQGIAERQVALQQAQAGDYRDLARVRLGELADTDLRQRLDRTEQQVVALLERRRAAVDGLQGRIEAVEASHRELEAQRGAQAERVDQAAEVVDEAEAQSQAVLDADPDYRAQREKAEAAERKAMHADDKATRSREELEQKGAAYRDDPLFMYLWQRQYGLPSYKASGLIRLLDGKVARLIGFAGARANYSRLNEIPERLSQHAAALKAAADTEIEALKGLDEAALSADGVPALEQTLAAEQSNLDEIDRRIEQSEGAQQALLDEKGQFATGEDEYSRKAVEYLATEFRREDLSLLRREALNTPNPDDDLILSRMLQREDEHRQLEGTVAGLRDAIKQHQRRLAELKALRADFKRNRYDRAGSTFGDNSLIATMLGHFLEGLLDRRELWKVLKEQQRYRPQQSDPTFGSGGFGRGSVWNGGLGDLGNLGDIIGGIARGGLGGGRGAGTGGDFRRRGSKRGGGGGFRTGGGF